MAGYNEEPKDMAKSTDQYFNWPSRHLLSGEKNRANYFKICVPLTNAAMKGNINKALRFIDMNGESVIRAAITEGYETILHVAVGARQINFVQVILELMSPKDLMLQDMKGNTAFCFAAMIGNLQIAKMLLKKNANLSTIRGGQNMTPLYLAASFGHRYMVKFLYPGTKQILTTEDRIATFFISIITGLYDLALDLLESDKDLAVARHDQYGSALEMLAQRPSAFVSRSGGLFKKLINLVPGMKFFADQDTEMISTQVLMLLKCLLKEKLPREDDGAAEIKRNLRNSLFDAARLGNSEFLAELIHFYPDLVHELDENARNIFHIAVLHGHNNILNLLSEIGFAKELSMTMTYVDKELPFYIAVEMDGHPHIEMDGKETPQKGWANAAFPVGEEIERCCGRRSSFPKTKPPGINDFSTKTYDEKDVAGRRKSGGEGRGTDVI